MRPAPPSHIEKADPSEAGCWIEGHWGIYGSQRLITIASCYGFQTIPIVDSDIPGDVAETLYAESESAEEWLNEYIAPEGFSFGWHDGEFFLQSTEWWEEESY